ncbi:MAG TPA: phosphate acetyltransferase, partial [Bacteroidetes bacterium]|nr:phosphate acetyltransferase [Bacteroidota bacterium]
MDFIQSIQDKARNRKRTVVLPEGTEDRMIRAAAIIREKRIADLILLADENEIRGKAKKLGVDLEGVTILDPEKSPDFDSYAETYYELRKEKGMTPEQAR